MRASRAIVAAAALVLLLASGAPASHTPAPATVTIAGSLQSELGCSGDWQPDCAATHLVYDAGDDAWQRSFDVPAGSWEYKAPLNDSWAENYGANATRDGANIALTLGSARNVTFYYDHETHWLADSVNSTIAVAPGSFQSELGCPGDWDPGCLRSWLQDPDGDGTYGFSTTALPAGSYETKVAIGESWDENYGAGGVPNGANIPFTVTAGATVTFTYVASTHVLTVAVVAPGPGHDGNVEWDGIRHDSRDPLYRTPGGAVPAGTPVKLRLRTWHGDVTGVSARIFDVNAAAQRIEPMAFAAEGVSCYDGSSRLCDFYELTLANAEADNLWYRFVVSDGSDTDYYADDTAALDGGLGQTSDDPVDRSWALTVHEPGFAAPGWASSAVIYQIFPDRFRNGNRRNDPRAGDERYDEPVITKTWNALPEGFCRNYTGGCSEGPRGRDYFGGDLKGVRQKLDYLQQLGVTAIYFNPIFWARSNHRYDTADYERIDPALGTQKEFAKLVKQARKHGIRVILDGVFNHMSSDSPRFDRYARYPGLGACESASSPFRSWFTFRNANAPCGSADYESWFGFDSIPTLLKTNPAVQDYFVRGPTSITRRWLDAGAAGWRMDVSGDASFPDGYWEAFREVVKSVDPEALTISETWQKDTALLRAVRGDRFDTSMNYRLRDAVIGLLSPNPFDPKGFGDSGRQLAPSEFASRLASIREDFPDAAFFSAMNLIDSHDTERALWTLTPGPDTRAAKEQDAANVAEGKRRLRLASLLQFTLPGAPTVYYGDEVGVTGDDDPDDRRTYPWADLGGIPDTALLGHYTSLAALRRAHPSLTAGSFAIASVDDAAGTVVLERRTATERALVALNVSGSERTLPSAGTLAQSVGTASVAGGTLTLGPLSGAVLFESGDFAPPAAPAGLAAVEGSAQVALSWGAVGDAAGYDVYRSPLSGGGFVKLNAAPVAGTSYVDATAENAHTYYYVVRALDAAGNASDASNEVVALPHLTIGWANTQWPPTLAHTISVTDRTDDVYGQVWIDGATSAPGPTDGLIAQLGFGPDGSSPSAAWTWVDAAFNTQAGSNDEFVASLLPEAVGTYDYAYRYSTTAGREWVYADLNGIGDGYSPADAGSLTVSPSSDATAPAVPGGLRVVSASPAGVELAWDAVTGDPTLHGYEVARAAAAAGPYTTLGRVTTTGFTDTAVTQGETYHYVVRSLDGSFNRSADSVPVSATAELRTVTVVFTVTVPATTDATGRSVHIAGLLDRLDGGLPQWDPAGVVLTRLDATHWRVTLTGKEFTQLAYKYVLGAWEYVEKDAACGEIGDRQLTLSYGATGVQNVSDTAENWRNVAPCGN
ncbi:MAG: alpha-amylase family glycosyl hydrolase [Gaiellaceae bacterium]